jgi:hypothetical protein
MGAHTQLIYSTRRRLRTQIPDIAHDGPISSRISGGVIHNEKRSTTIHLTVPSTFPVPAPTPMPLVCSHSTHAP